jgi:hypothetical protein
MIRTQGRRDFLRTTLSSLGLLTLAGCDGGGMTSAGTSATTTPPAPIDTTSEGTPMFQVSASLLASIVARPETFLAGYAGLGDTATPADAYVRTQLGAPFATLSDSGCIATFASVVAFNAAPVGATSLAPMTATMKQLLSSPALACGHFCKLTTLFSLLGNPLLIPPDAAAGDAAKPTVHFLVWLDTVPLGTGYHSQLIISNVLDSAYLLLDPLYAYALRIPYVGAGPQTSLTVIENATMMMQTPIAQDNLAVLDPRGTSSSPQILTTVLGGTLGPQYIFHDSLYGSEGWDTQIGLIFDDLG